MSDQDLRELERRFRETGSIQDEIAWLKARLARGEVSREQIEWRSRCGSPAARRLLGRPLNPKVESPSRRDLLEAVYGNGREWGLEFRGELLAYLVEGEFVGGFLELYRLEVVTPAQATPDLSEILTPLKIEEFTFRHRLHPEFEAEGALLQEYREEEGRLLVRSLHVDLAPPTWFDRLRARLRGDPYPWR